VYQKWLAHPYQVSTISSLRASTHSLQKSRMSPDFIELRIDHRGGQIEKLGIDAHR
jgi:hypothetical protein